MQVISVVVKVYIEDGIDAHEVIADCNYSFSGDGIIDTEIIEVYDV
jgi:hypothetical protein